MESEAVAARRCWIVRRSAFRAAAGWADATAPLGDSLRAAERHKLLKTGRADANVPLGDSLRAPERHKLLKTGRADANVPLGDGLRAPERHKAAQLL